jgi:hypothetical protein
VSFERREGVISGGGASSVLFDIVAEVVEDESERVEKKRGKPNCPTSGVRQFVGYYRAERELQISSQTFSTLLSNLS